MVLFSAYFFILLLSLAMPGKTRNLLLIHGKNNEFIFPKEFRWNSSLSDNGKNEVRKIPLLAFKKTDHCLRKDIKLNGSLI